MGSTSYRNENIQLFAILASIAVHVLLALSAQFISNSKPVQNSNIAIEILDQRQEERTKVTDPDLDRLEKAVEEIQKRAQFLSKETVRVKKQTKASVTDHTRNRKGKDPNARQDRQALARKKRATENRDLLGLSLPLMTTDPSEQTSAAGVSTISEHIPNIETGSITALNADRLSYYTFFERINGQLRNHWVDHIREIAEGLSAPALSRMAMYPRITEVEIVLDIKGYLFEVNILKSSGSELIDRAAIMAFHESTPYLNPPQDLVSKEDNMIRLYYGFRVEFTPRLMAGP